MFNVGCSMTWCHCLCKCLVASKIIPPLKGQRWVQSPCEDSVDRITYATEAAQKVTGTIDFIVTIFIRPRIETCHVPLYVDLNLITLPKHSKSHQFVLGKFMYTITLKPVLNGWYILTDKIYEKFVHKSVWNYRKMIHSRLITNCNLHPSN